MTCRFLREIDAPEWVTACEFSPDRTESDHAGGASRRRVLRRVKRSVKIWGSEGGITILAHQSPEVVNIAGRSCCSSAFSLSVVGVTPANMP